jgi:hypothetical protein
MRKNADYWAGFDAEAARLGRSGSSFTELARQVTQALGRDQGRKQKIFARSPGVFSSMDAEEFGRMSSRELAERELKELGISAGDSDPEALLDAHHAGRKWARDYQIPGNRLTGGNTIQGNNGIELIGGSASDAREGGSFIDRYIVGDGK